MGLDLLGAGLPWLGWFGFNTFVNTLLVPAGELVPWMLLDHFTVAN